MFGMPIEIAIAFIFLGGFSLGCIVTNGWLKYKAYEDLFKPKRR